MIQRTGRLGSLTEVEGGYELQFKRELRHPIEKVWAALTEPNKMTHWFAVATEFEKSVGGSVELRWQNTDTEGNYAVARGRITRFVPPTLIEYDTDIHGLIRWELEPSAEGCRLTLTVRHDLPDEFITIVMAGWHVHIDFLEDALDGTPVDWSDWPVDRWEAHHAEYKRLLG
ncbi:MAG: SRPBCC family protein [Thermomicrobiales bacterium]